MVHLNLSLYLITIMKDGLGKVKTLEHISLDLNQILLFHTQPIRNTIMLMELLQESSSWKVIEPQPKCLSRRLKIM